MPNQKRDEIIFNIFLILVFVIFVAMSFSYNGKAQFFPLVFGTIALVLTLLQVVVKVMKNPPKFLNFINKKGALGGEQGGGGESHSEPLPWNRVFGVFVWLIVYTLLICYLHYMLATLIFLIAFLHFVGKLKIVKNVLFSCIFVGCLFALFSLILQ